MMRGEYMNLSWIWQTALIYIVGVFILRLGGRKSISQMTISQTIVMIALGALIIVPVAGRGLLITFLTAALLVILMIITEYLSLKVDFLETLFSGKAVIVIENGILNTKNLKKLRMSIDKLETRLRQEGISYIEDVQYATIEVSGQLGYELKSNKRPVTQEDLSRLMAEIYALKAIMTNSSVTHSNENRKNNIFEEIYTEKFEGNKNEQ